MNLLPPSSETESPEDVKLYLAPMEGITDFLMRDLLTRQGDIDLCFTEFLRVTNRLHPHSVFYKNCPELKMNSRTRSGTPVTLQLLGGLPEPLAENAHRAVELGAIGIDLNFGCPAKTVNRHDGGAVLLQYPHRLFDIVKKVRANLPGNIPVSAKIRLGFQDASLVLENARAVAEAGASFLSVHCRTKIQGYRPPAHWEWISKISEIIPIPVVANGDISSLESFERCKSISASRRYMIGRGGIVDPSLFKTIKTSRKTNLLKESNSGSGWFLAKNQLPDFFNACAEYINIHFATARTKQWLRALAPSHPEARGFFDELKVLKPTEFHIRLEKLCSIPNFTKTGL